MDNLTLFGKRLRSIRGRRSRASIAEAAKISSGYLGELERGEKWPALDIIVELAKVLAVSPGTFFEFESEEVDSLECPAIFAPVKKRHWNKERVWHEEKSTSQSKW